MLSMTLYRGLLRLYPAFHRERFGEEMIAVFGDMQAETVSKGTMARVVFWTRESAGVVAGALQEHWRALGGEDVLAMVSDEGVYDANRISFSEGNCGFDGDYSRRRDAGHSEGRKHFGVAARRRGSSHRTDPSDALGFVGRHCDGPCFLLRCGNDRVGDSICHAPVGSAPVGRNRGRAEIASSGEDHSARC